MAPPGQGDGDALEATATDVALLTRSRNRIRILEEFVDHGERHRDELRSASDVTRTTLNRNLDALEEAGWVRSDGLTYRLTPCGELVAEAVIDLVETTHVANQLQDALRWLPVSALDLDLRHLGDAEVWVPEPGDPYAMVNHHVRTIRSMERCRALLHVTGLHATEAGHEAVVEGGADAELVVTPAVAETLTGKPEYEALLDEMRATGRCDLLVYDGDVPFSLAVFDGTVQLLADEDGEPRALVESDADAVRTWAVDCYETYRQEADPVE